MRPLGTIDKLFVAAIWLFFGYGALDFLSRGGDHAMQRALACLIFPVGLSVFLLIYKREGRRSDEKARQLLAQFPGPIVVGREPRRHLWRAFFSLALAVGLAILMFTAAPSKWSLVGLAVIGVFTIGTVIHLRAMAVGWTIALSLAGFETMSGQLRKSYQWPDVDDFRVRSTRYWNYVMFHRVGTPPINKGSLLFRRDVERLPDRYGMFADNLAWLMNEWRAKALTVTTNTPPLDDETAALEQRGRSLLDYA